MLTPSRRPPDAARRARRRTCRSPSFRRLRQLVQRIAGRPAHAPAPLVVEMAQERVVLRPHVLAPRHHALLGGAVAVALLDRLDEDHVLDQVAAERTPELVVIAHPERAILRRLALDAEPAILEQRVARPDRRRGVDADAG